VTLLPGVLTAAEAAGLVAAYDAGALSTVVGPAMLTRPLVAGPVRRLLALLGEPAPVSPSYARVEHKPAGHALHHDAGPHMPWVRRSVSVLLTAPGELEQAGPSIVGEGWEVSAAEHHLAAVVMGTREPHAVPPHAGRRIVLLMFLA